MNTSSRVNSGEHLQGLLVRQTIISNKGPPGWKWSQDPNVRVSKIRLTRVEESSESQSKDRGVKDPNTTQMAMWARKTHNHVSKKFLQCLDSTSVEEFGRRIPTGSRLWYQLVTPPIQSYTNHACKCVRSRSRIHGTISQHNSRHKLK